MWAHSNHKTRIFNVNKENSVEKYFKYDYVNGYNDMLFCEIKLLMKFGKSVCLLAVFSVCNRRFSSKKNINSEKKILNIKIFSIKLHI